MLGSAAIPAQQTITAFHQGLAWVAQVGMFLTLGLLVFPSQLGDIALEGTVLALVAAVVARPLAVIPATLFAHYSARERLVLGWAGLRGAVPVVLATFPVIADVPGSRELFNIVFFAVLVSTVLQGATFEPLAARLGMTTSEPALPRPLAEGGTIRRLGAEILEYPIAPDDAIVGHRVRDLGLPRDAVVNVIVRDDQAIPPRGTTRLRAGDRLHVLIRQESARELYDIRDRWHTGPIGRPPRPRAAVRGREAMFSAGAWREQDGDPARPEAVARTAGDRAAADPARRRRRAVRARGRPLRHHGPALRGGHTHRGLGLGAAADAQREPGRAGVAADGDRRARGGPAGVSVGYTGVTYAPPMPPSTRKVEAVMYDDSSDARNRTALASSTASAKRPIGTWTIRRAACSGSLAYSS